MPAVIQGFAAIGAALASGLGALGGSLASAFGPSIVVDGAPSHIRRHEWPIRAPSRKALFNSAFDGAEKFRMAAPMRTVLEGMANLTFEQIEEQGRAEVEAGRGVIPAVPEEARPFVDELERHRPGAWAEMASKGCFVRALDGDCLDRVIGTDCAVVVDPSAEIAQGDTAFFTVKGLPLTVGKVVVGLLKGRLWFWMSRPEGFWTIAEENIISVDRVVLVLPRDGEPFEPPHVAFPRFQDVEPYEPPKLDATLAYEEAILSVWRAARALA